MKQSLWQKYGAHYLAYALGLLTWILGYVHSCGTPLAPEAARYVGVLGIVVVALHQVQTFLRTPETVPAPAPEATRQTGRASIGLLIAIATSLAVALVGCASLASAMGTAASASAVQAAIDLAVGTAIQQTAKTAPAQAREAQQIQQIAAALEGVLSGQSTTIALLDQALEAKIVAAHLAPGEAAAAAALVQTIQAVVLQQVQGGTSKLSASQTVAVTTVLNDVIQAASFYNVHAMAEMRADTASP